MKLNKYIILLFVLTFMLSFALFLFYVKEKFIERILYAWKQKNNNGNITFDGLGNFKNDYYLSLDNYNNYSTHIHLFTDNFNLRYLVKKNNKHSPLYIIDTNKDPISIVDEMIINFNKM